MVQTDDCSREKCRLLGAKRKTIGCKKEDYWVQKGRLLGVCMIFE